MPEINGIHYRWYQGEASNLSPIVFVHGACSDSRVWPKSLREIGGGPVLMLDLPGHGQSQSICRHSINAYSQDLLTFFNALDVWAPLLVGVGMGASIVMDYVALFKDRVRGFVAINFSQTYFIPNPVLSALEANQYFTAATEMMRKGMHKFTNPGVWEQVAEIAGTQRNSVLAADLHMMHYYNWNRDWDSVASVPGFLLYGSGDRLLRGIPTDLPGNLSSRMIPGSGHWLPLENPEIVLEELLCFLEVLPPTS